MAQYKNVDIIPDDSISRVHLSQNDVGRTLIFYLFENGLSWSVPASSTIKCQGTKPSGFGFSVSCTYSGNTVTCVTTEEMTDEYGQIEADLVITSSDESQVFGTSNFVLDIEKNPHPASTEDGNIETAIALTARIEALETAVSELEASEGLTNAIKLALLQIAQKVAYIDANGQDYYDDLYDALYPPAPPATLTSISAVYTQSGTVYDTDSLDSLKSDLVVTAHYDDSATQTVTTYTLSGTLTAGTSTITVTYGGKTTTFTVTVTHATTQYTITNTLTNCTNSNNASVINELTSYSGTLTATSGYVLSTVTVTMGGTDVTSTVYNSGTGAISIASVTGNVVITAEAVEDVGWISGVPYDIDWGAGGYELSSLGVVQASGNSNDHVSGFLPCHGASAIVCPTTPYMGYLCFYDENETYLEKVGQVTAIENPFPYPVPRNAYYVRYYVRTDSASNAIPYLYTKLTESTAYALNTHYVMDYASGTESSIGKSLKGLCYGATKLQTSMYQRSWIYFYDAEKSQISYTIRQQNATEIDIPSGTYYIALESNTGNTNNPWVMFTE